MKLVKELASLETFDGWGKLELNEQNKLTIETQALEKATETYEMSNLEIGEHLDKISQVLSPKRQFNKWMILVAGRPEEGQEPLMGISGNG